MEVEEGLWNFMGNTVEYEGGDYGYDLDSREDIPVGMLVLMGTFIKKFEES